MNKLRYRVVFNRVRGLCVVVSENARSNSKVAGTRMPGALPAPHSGVGLPALKVVSSTLMAAFGASAFLIGAADAQIIADLRAPGQQRATILNTANGVLQVNVQTPSAAGVSRNTYVQFDIPASGAILNNSRVDVQTQLGGWVRANPWVAEGGARVILNEVNSTDPSHLRGFIEVAGPRAEVIVANPAGIAIDGGGFINVSRATLTTGVPEMKDGAVNGYTVKRGEVSIDGAGLDASQTDYTAVIARSLSVNAALWAKQLNVTAGVIQTSADGTTATAQAASGAAPAYGIDVSRLGGMYANKIFLIGTEAGVGVRNAGAIGAAAGDLIVTSEGRLENSGSLLSAQQLALKAHGAAANSGTMSGDGGVTLTANTLQNSGQIHSAGQTVLAVQGDANNSNGTIEAQHIELTSASGSILNRQGKLVQSGGAGLDLDAASLLNTAGGQIGLPAVVADGGTSDAPPSTQDGSSTALPNGLLRAAQTIDNFGGQIAAGGALTLKADALDNSGGQLRLPLLNFDGSTFSNRGGTLEVLHDFTAHASSFDNAGGRLLIGEQFNANLTKFDNAAGLLQAGSWRIAVTLGLDNHGGVLRSMGNQTAVLAVGGQLSNENGTLESAGSMQLSAGTIAGSGSRLTSLGDKTYISTAAPPMRSAPTGTSPAQQQFVQAPWTMAGSFRPEWT
jgi:filamentous hemagglutinin